MKTFEDLFEMLVPAEGKADTVLGENIRALSYISYRYLNNGERYDVDCREYDNDEEKAIFGEVRNSLNNSVNYLMSNSNPLHNLFNKPYDYFDQSRFAKVRQTEYQLKIKRPLAYDYHLEKDEDYDGYLDTFENMASRLVINYCLRDSIKQIVETGKPFKIDDMSEGKGLITPYDFRVLQTLDDNVRWGALILDYNRAYDRAKELWEDGIKHFFDKNEIDCKDFEG